jgi:hypothetical protein
MSTLSSLRQLLFATYLGLACSVSDAQVTAVPFTEKSLFFSDAPTLTFVWPSPQAQFTLIFIPGGEGHLGLTPERKNLGGFYGSTLKPLSDNALTHGLFNVVVFDSPVNLPVGTDYPISRQSQEHLLRIQSVVQYFQQQFGLPIWLMGHSNGAASMTEYLKFIAKGGATQSVMGAIYSSARHGSTFHQQTQIPVLFLAHEKDNCPKSTPSHARLVYEELKKTDHKAVEFVTLHQGQAQALSPCISGFHMFYGAEPEAYQAIDQFAFSLASKAGE